MIPLGPLPIENVYRYLKDRNEIGDLPDNLGEFSKRMYEDTVLSSKVYEYIKGYNDVADLPGSHDEFRIGLGFVQKKSPGLPVQPSGGPLSPQGQWQAGALEFQQQEKELGRAAHPFLPGLVEQSPAAPGDEEAAKDFVTRDPRDNGINVVSSMAGKFDQGVIKTFAGVPKAVAKGMSMVLGERLEDQLLFKAADWAEKQLEPYMQSNPIYDETSAAKFMEGAGAITAYIMGGSLGRTSRVSDLAIPSATKAVMRETAKHLPGAFMASSGVAMAEYENAMAMTGDQKLADEAFVRGLSAGIPFLVSPTINAFNKHTNNAFRYAMGEAAKSGVVGAFQMATSHALANLGAKESYDKSREIMDGVMEAGGSGFMINGLLSGIIAYASHSPTVYNARIIDYARKQQKLLSDNNIRDTDFYRRGTEPIRMEKNKDGVWEVAKPVPVPVESPVKEIGAAQKPLAEIKGVESLAKIEPEQGGLKPVFEEGDATAKAVVDPGEWPHYQSGKIGLEEVSPEGESLHPSQIDIVEAAERKKAQEEFNKKGFEIVKPENYKTPSAEEPIVAVTYRGQHGPGEGLETRLGSYSFSSKEAAQLYADEPNNRQLDKEAVNPRVIKAEVTIRRPVINTPDDPFIDLSRIVDILGKDDAIAIAKKYSAEIEGMESWEETYADSYESVEQLLDQNPDAINSLSMLSFPLFDDPQIVAKFREKGYDGAVHAGYGEFDDPEYKVFSKDQVKLIPEGNALPQSEQLINNTGTTQAFFSDVVKGESDKFKPVRPYEQIMKFSPKQQKFNESYSKFKGNFDEHIATSIPGFRDVQVKKGQAIIDMLPKGGTMVDIAGSEGGLAKAITEVSGASPVEYTDKQLKEVSESLSRGEMPKFLSVPEKITEAMVMNLRETLSRGFGAKGVEIVSDDKLNELASQITGDIRFLAEDILTGKVKVPEKIMKANFAEKMVWLEGWSRTRNKVFKGKDLTKMPDKDIVEGLKTEILKEIEVIRQMFPDYKSFYRYEVGTVLRDEVRRFAVERYGRQLTHGEENLYQLLSTYSSPGVDPARDSQVGLMIFDRYMRTGELNEYSESPKVDKKTGEIILDESGNVVYPRFTVKWASDSFQKFKDVYEFFGKDLEAATNWLKAMHSYEELSKVVGKPVKGKGSLPEHEYLTKKEGGKGIMATTGPKLGSYFNNRTGDFSTNTKDMWNARTFYRITGLKLTEMVKDKDTGKMVEKAIGKMPDKTKEDIRRRRLLDEAYLAVADELGMEMSDVQELTWHVEKRLSEVMGMPEKMERPIEGMYKAADKMIPGFSSRAPQFMVDGTGKIYGFTYDGKIYLSKDSLNPNTTVHEAGEIWIEWARTNRPDLYSAGLEKVKGSPYEAQVMASEFYKKRTEGMNEQQRREYIQREALARAIGDQGEKFVNEAKRSSFKQWLKALWDSIMDHIGIQHMSVDDISKMSLSDFAKKVVADIFNPGAKKPVAKEPPKQPEPPKVDSKEPKVGDEITFLFMGGGERTGVIQRIAEDGRYKVKSSSGTNYTVAKSDIVTGEPDLTPSTIEGISKEIDKSVARHSKSTKKPKGTKGGIIPVTVNPFAVVRGVLNLINKGQDLTIAKWSMNVENWIAKMENKALASRSAAVRTSAQALRNVVGGMPYTQEDLSSKMKFLGAKNMAPVQAKIMFDNWYKIIDSDPRSLARVHAVMDPDVYAKDPVLSKIKYANLNPSERALLDQLRLANNHIHEWTFNNGLISRQTYDRYKEKYIPRMYEEFELMPEDLKETLKAGGADMSFLYRRVDDAGIEILRDPVYATAKRIGQIMQVQAVFDYAKAIAASKTIRVSDTEFPGSVQLGKPVNLPSDPGARGVYRPYYGVLTGKYVPQYIAEDFRGFFFTNHAMQGFYDFAKGMDRMALKQFLKKSKTVYSPLVQFGNFTANFSLAFWNGIDPITFSINYARGISEIKKQGQYYMDAVADGVLGSGIMLSDLKSVAPQSTPGVLGSRIGKLVDLEHEMWGKLSDAFSSNRFTSWIPKLFNYTTDKATSLYSATDDVAKMSAYITHREAGYSREDAARRVYEGFQNYATVGKMYDVASKTPVFGNPYIKFKADLGRMMKNAVTRRPLNTALYLGLLYMVYSWLWDESGEDENVKAIREGRSFIPRIYTPFGSLPMVWQTPFGEVNFSRYMTPYYSYDKGDANTLVGQISDWLPYQVDWAQSPTSKDGKILWPEMPDVLWGVYAQVALDQDFRGKSIHDPYGNKFHSLAVSDEERLLNSVHYIMRSQVPFFRSVDDVRAAMEGRPDYYKRMRTVRQAILNNIIKVQEFGPKEAQDYIIREIDFKLDKITSLQSDLSFLTEAYMKELVAIDGYNMNAAQKEQAKFKALTQYKERAMVKELEMTKVMKELVDSQKLFENLAKPGALK